jgi:oxygen-independent coproporphyrinogen-3 oxidase
VQSFNDSVLTFLNRRHNSKEALQSIANLKKVGYNNITLDLIYGIPGLSKDEWTKNLQIINTLDIPHLSAYHLSIEPKTVFSVWQKKGKFTQVAEEESLAHYNILTTFAHNNGYDHYEISNFAKNKMYSKHNTSYWQGKPYLGIGPSAHSYQQNRRWNISNNSKYIESLRNNHNDYFDFEELSKKEMYNDYIMTSLRTKWGADWNFIKKNFGAEFLAHTLKTIKKIGNEDKVIENKSGFKLTEKGWFISDLLISEFFFI